MCGAVLAGIVALAAAPEGFTVAELTEKVDSMTGQSEYSTRQAAYDIRKLRAKGLSRNRSDRAVITLHRRPRARSPRSASYAIK